MGVRVDYANAVNVDDLDTIYITGGGYVRYPFRGIGRDSLWGYEETAFGGELNRGQNAVLGNIGDVEFNLVARCDISFKYMNIQDYIALRNISKQRVCYVDYYNQDTGAREHNQEMTFTNTERGKLHAFGSKDFGRRDISISLVATNRDRVGIINSACPITYESNGGQGSIIVEEKNQPNWGDEFKIADGTGFTNAGHRLKWFNTKPDDSEWRYLPNQNITVFKPMTLYAIWEEA